MNNIANPLGDNLPKNEQRFYPSVLTYLKKNGYLTEGYADDGKTKFEFIQLGAPVQADVAGVKDVGNLYSHEFEIVAVEVKDGRRMKVRHAEQALGYSMFAHRCYLAMPIKFTEENKAYAKHMGIGLLEIDGKNVREVLSPELKKPDETIMMWFLRRSLALVRCVVCGCVIHRFYNKETQHFRRRNVFGEQKNLFVCSQCSELIKLRTHRV
jgi:hypothetical protein